MTYAILNVPYYNYRLGGLRIMTYAVLDVPDYNYSIVGPKTPF